MVINLRVRRRERDKPENTASQVRSPTSTAESSSMLSGTRTEVVETLSFFSFILGWEGKKDVKRRKRDASGRLVKWNRLSGGRFTSPGRSMIALSALARV